jgi:cation diffusion facilitator CzcD-associated flavoprotein CzcO
MPLLEETGHMPSEKYAHGPEILTHCQNIGRQYGLYNNALFHTVVEDMSWDAANVRWNIRTNRGDAFTAQFIGMGTGPLHVPKLPGIPGIETFKGHSFHTSRWDYRYTGGDPSGAPMEKLMDKRVAIIGTGATSVQCVPHLARACKELFVFQRTPSSVDVRANAPIDANWFAGVATPGWQQRWLENFTANQAGGTADDDLIQDGWTDLSRRIRSKTMSLPREKMTPQIMMAAFEDSDFEKMEEIRARVDSIVEDRDTAQKLKAWYQQLCKRPCFHDAYLQAFNEPGVHLIDTDGNGGRGDHRDRGRYRRERIPGGLHHLRLGVRGGHGIPAPGRLRPDRPGRRQALGLLGRRDAHQARHPRARLPERFPGPTHPGSEPDFQL